MTCENLTPRPLFDTEVGQLKARIEALERNTLTLEKVKAWIFGEGKNSISSMVTSSNAFVVGAGAIATGVISSWAKPWEQNFWGQVDQKFKSVDVKLTSVVTKADSAVDAAAGARQVAESKFATAMDRILGVDTKVGKVQQTVNQVNGQIHHVGKRVTSLTTQVTNQGKQIIANSRTLTKVSNVASSAFSKVGALFAKVAPILNIAGFLLSLASAGFTAYQIIQLMRRMDAEERISFILTTALTFAGGGLLTAAYVQALDAKVTALGVKQEMDTNRIIGVVSSEHVATRKQVAFSGEVLRNEHRQTRAYVGTTTEGTNLLIRQTNDSNYVQHQTTRQTVTTSASTTQGIVRNSIQGLQNRMSVFYQNIMAAIAAISASTGAAFNATVVARLDGILAAINAMQDTMLGKFNKLWDYLKMDRVLNVITTAAAVHNAAMLSRNLAVSLIDTIGETLGLVGLKDVDGNAYDLNSMLGNAAEGIVIRLIGAEAYAGLSKTWREANRIISAGAAVVMSIRSAQWALAEGIEIMSSWIAKIGNGLEDEGVVSDRKWPWMRENLNIKSFTALDKINNGLESAEEITDSIYLTVSAGTEISEAVTQMRTSSQNFKDTLAMDETTADEELQDSESESQAPTVTDEDLAEYEPEQP